MHHSVSKHKSCIDAKKLALFEGATATAVSTVRVRMRDSAFISSVLCKFAQSVRRKLA